MQNYNSKLKVYLGADHKGFTLKEKIKDWLLKWGYDFEDMGAYTLDPDDDYPVYAKKVASVVADEEGLKGILLCGSGVGVDVAANKFDGIRSGIGMTPQQVKAGRNDDDMNVLVLAADYTDLHEAQEMVEAFLETPFSGVPRFKKRLEDIKKIEVNN